MTIIKAETVLSSSHVDPEVPMIWSGLLTYPRCIHAEFMTHRVLSKNSASSRAIPVRRMIQDVIDHPYIPLKWGKEQKGMQAMEFFEGDEKQALIDQWLSDRDEAVQKATWYVDRGAHKQIVNRILEPYAHIKVFVTGTKWSNFLGLRDHEAAEPHIQILAREIRRELAKPPMQFLVPGQWHLPWVKPEDWRKFEPTHTPHPDLIKLSVARSAHTSYQTVDGREMTFHLATELADRLLSSRPLHASPTEHQAKADRRITTTSNQRWEGSGLEGNLSPGWVQLRKTLSNESL